MEQEAERIHELTGDVSSTSQSIGEGGNSSDILRSLLRLLVGGSEIGVEELRRRLQLWEDNIVDEVQEQEEPDIIEFDFGGDEQPYRKSLADLPEETISNTIRYALIGLLFETQGGLRSSLDLAGRLSHAVGRFTRPWLRPAKNSRVFSPLRKRYDSLVARGEEEVVHWIETGRTESRHSRLLVETALTETVDSTIESLSENSGVQQLVQSQSTGLADEVLKEARERTVSADTYLEGVLRSLLRRRPRKELPQPSEDIKQQALTFREQQEKWMEEQ